MILSNPRCDFVSTIIRKEKPKKQLIYAISSNKIGLSPIYYRCGDKAHLRITENRRLAIAAAAIVHKITNRRRPLVFLPVFPSKRGSTVVAVMVAVSLKKRN